MYILRLIPVTTYSGVPDTWKEILSDTKYTITATKMLVVTQNNKANGQNSILVASPEKVEYFEKHFLMDLIIGMFNYPKCY